MLLFLVALPLILCSVIRASDAHAGHRRNAARRLGRSSHHDRRNVSLAPSPRFLSRRAVLPAGWSVLNRNSNDGSGCYLDTSTSRVLSTQLSGSFGIKDCLSACQAANYAFAGVQYGTQCWCGTTVPNTLTSKPSSECGMNCPESTDKCGGNYRMNIYTYTKPAASGGSAATPLPPAPATAPDGWTYQGCYSDTTSGRTLSVQLSGGSASVPACLSQCQSRGYTYGAIEYGWQCWCGNALGAKTYIMGENRCDMACKVGGLGCGGYYAMSLWKFGTAVGLPSSSTTTSTTTSTTSTTTTAPTSTASPAGWTYLYCAVDASARALTGATYLDTQGMTVPKCLAFCKSKGMSLGGVQTGSECWCGNSLQNGLGQRADEGTCGGVCTGDSTARTKCGGDWRISLWSTLSGPALSSALGSTSATSTTTTIAQTAPTPGSYQPTNPVPASSAQKYIWAHVILGNVYPYTYNMWMDDIRLASANGIDGFILNLGPDSWQPARVADAYNAASASGTGFKMMLSFDMAEFTCGGWENVPLFKTYLDKYMYHPAAAKVEGRTAVTTFSGSDCTFGQGSVNAGWNAVFGGYRNNIYFMPAYNTDPQRLGSFDIQAEVNWGSAWPSNGADIETSRDSWFMQQLRPSGKKYVGTLAPGFFTHFSYKNWLWRGDNWLFSQRWEDLIAMRASIDQVEIISWNDYGESSHIDTIKGDMPPEAKLFATSDLPHEDILSLNAFYAKAWKDGRYPLITQDKVWVMARPHPAYANAWGDNLGAPDHRDWTQDNFYAQVHLAAAANVILCAGGNCKTFAGNAGINRFAQPMSAGQGISVQVTRNGQTTVNLRPSFTFNGNPQRYNFNYLIKSS